MKILLIDSQSCFLDFAIRCREAGHEVRWFIGPNKDNTISLTGKGLGLRVSDWQPHMNWADLIVLSDNAKYIPALEGYRKRGYPIFGPNRETTSWELDRAKGQEILQKHGIDIIPSVEFTNYDKAINYVKSTMKRYVSKPNGDADKALSYVSKSPSDMVFMLEHWKKKGTLKDRFILQEFHGGIEVAVGGWMGYNGFSQWWCENFEHKKLMNDDKGVNCYSEDTEVLTKRGWLPFNEVTLDDEVASYQPMDGSIFYERPEKLHWVDYEGEMISFKNRYVDLLVTPTHQMWGTRRKMGDWKFYDAKDTPCEFTIKQSGEFRQTTRNNFFKLPEYLDGRGYTHPEKEIEMGIWAGFLGLYLSEGSCGKNRVTIAQNPGDKKDIMEGILRRLPFKVRSSKMGFVINSVQLASYLRGFGHSRQKYIPNYIKECDKDVVNVFLDAYLLGDGDIHDGKRRWHTGSWRMAGDIQELLTIHGSTGVICTDKRISMVSPLNGKTYKANPVYSIEESKRKNVSIRSGQKSTIHYKGKIGCVTLRTTHLLFVRRNGRVCISGNTGEMGTAIKYVKESVLADCLLRPLEPELLRQGYTGYIDVSVIIDKRGNIWPLEFTTRPGWPLFQIQQALHKGDPAQWMLDAIGGKDTFNPSEDVSVGVVMAMPDFPYSRLTKKECYGYPIYGIDSVRNHIHPAECAWDKAPSEENGKIIEKQMLVTAGDYVLVCTGTGSSVKEAKEKAYKVVDKVELPNSPIYRTDIGHRLEKQLPELQKLGFCESWAYEVEEEED